MPNSISVIICTYNRPEKVKKLALSIMKLSAEFDKLYIVDSSDDILDFSDFSDQLVYLRSSHKNQLYQRFLGANSAKSEFLMYLDDDMELLDDDIFKSLTELFKENQIVGRSIYWENKPNEENSQKNLQRRPPKKKTFLQLALTFYPNPATGKVGFCGIRGKYPVPNGNIEFLSGGAFCVRKEYFFKGFNFQLFDLFENKTGMGEDTILGYTLSKFGKIHFENKLSFWHNDEGQSNYILNLEDFHKRIIFSRKYLTLEKLRLDRKGFLIGKIYFHLYVLFRLLPLIISARKNNQKKQSIRGIIKGWKLANKFKFQYSIHDEEKWNTYLQTDLKNNESRNLN